VIPTLWAELRTCGRRGQTCAEAKKIDTPEFSSTADRARGCSCPLALQFPSKLDSGPFNLPTPTTALLFTLESIVTSNISRQLACRRQRMFPFRSTNVKATHYIGTDLESRFAEFGENLGSLHICMTKHFLLSIFFKIVADTSAIPQYIEFGSRKSVCKSLLSQRLIRLRSGSLSSFSGVHQLDRKQSSSGEMTSADGVLQVFL